MKKNNQAPKNNGSFELAQKGSMVYGAALWASLFIIGTGVVHNAPAEATMEAVRKSAISDPSAEDVRALPAGLHYVHSSKFDSVQVLVKYPDGEWSYAGILRDKDGDFVLSEDHKYRIDEVEARNDFSIDTQDGKITIAKGFRTIKAYAEEA